MFVKSIIISIGFLSLFACKSSSKMVVNDFFGIKMTPSEAKNFEIATYDEKEGVSYRQSPSMDPALSAWAECRGKEIKFKIVNNTDRPIISDYLNDQFVLVTMDDQEFSMEKGRGIDYLSSGSIKPRSEEEYLLSLPSRFWETQGMTVQEFDGDEFTENFWQGLNSVNTQKDNIKLIKIKLSGGDTIVLKRVPPPPLSD